MKCFLDLDGVVADFVGHACRKFNLQNPYANADRELPRDIAKLLQVPPAIFWDDLGYSFWSTMPLTPEGSQIYSMVTEAFGIENVCFLSAAVRTDGCTDGKRSWCRKHFPQTPLLVSQPAKAGAHVVKAFCAGPGTILIDDCVKNTGEFSFAGGRAFLYPRPWNPLFDREQDGLLMLERFIELAKSKAAG